MSIYAKRLNRKNRININKAYSNGERRIDIARQFNVAERTVDRWKNDDILYKSLIGIRKKRIGRPHKKHKKHIVIKKGDRRKKHVYKKNNDKYHHLKEKMIELYKELGSAAKVSKALMKDFDVKLSREAVLRRIPQELRSKNRKNKKGK